MKDSGADYEEIGIEHTDDISWITLVAPDRANAMSPRMLEEFSAALEHLRDHGAPILGIRGAGSGFCSGYDLSGVRATAHDVMADKERLERNVERFLDIWRHPKPVIAAVHGYCLAGATQMVSCADLAIVATDARIGEPGIPIGGGYIAPLWVHLVGAKRAKEFSMLPGNWIDGATAVEWGWANAAVPTSEVISTVESLAARMALVPSDVLRIKKASINRAVEHGGLVGAAAHVSDFDALSHRTDGVQRLRERLEAEGLKAVLKTFAGPSSTEIIRSAQEGA